MSAAEVIGLALTATLLGALLGAVVTSARARRQAWRQEARVRRLEAYARWLAAHLTLNRTSVSFVAACRALAAERHGSADLRRRRNEAKRARSAWCDALREHDRAKASLIVWSHDPQIGRKLGCLDPRAHDILRDAIDGDTNRFDRLLQKTRETDRSAMLLTQHATLADTVQPYALPHPVVRLVTSISQIVKRLLG